MIYSSINIAGSGGKRLCKTKMNEMIVSDNSLHHQETLPIGYHFQKPLQQ